MEYTPVTSFRRPISAVQLTRHLNADQPVKVGVSKWDALRKLATARQHYDLSDRDLTVLQTLLGFHPETELGADHPPAIVYPSNKAICERLNGMPCSTMRRHIARLVDAGIILRRDSPNGKRFVRRGGGPNIAYGFDLTPLITQFETFSRIATQVEQEEAHRARLREAVSLMRRDLAGFAAYGENSLPDAPIWNQMSDLARLTSRDLRRKLSIEELTVLSTKLQTALKEITARIDAEHAPDLSTNNAENEQHHQTSNKECNDIEKREVTLAGTSQSTNEYHQPPPPLRIVLEKCSEIQSFSQDTVRHWNDMVRLSDIVSPMMGITPLVWEEAKIRMGHTQAAAALAAMLERFTEIKSPSAYLRSLAKKAEKGTFSSGAMIRALGDRYA